MLVLFDIDLTLLSADGAGMKALDEAGRALYGPAFSVEGVPFAGRLDTLIVRDALRASGISDTRETRDALRAEYVRYLERRLAVTPGKRVLPGVQELLASLRARSEFTLGLLTGNFEPAAILKLVSVGIDPDPFRVRVFSEDAPGEPPSREQLVPVAMARYERIVGRPVRARAVTIIGDTPGDVACAAAHGCRCIAVATGRSSIAQLAGAGADHTLPDLSDTKGLIAMLSDWRDR